MLALARSLPLRPCFLLLLHLVRLGIEVVEAPVDLFVVSLSVSNDVLPFVPRISTRSCIMFVNYFLRASPLTAPPSWISSRLKRVAAIASQLNFLSAMLCAVGFVNREYLKRRRATG